MLKSEEAAGVYKARVMTLTIRTLIVQVILVVIGGVIFALGVIARPILRLTKPGFLAHVEWILDLMIASGLAIMVSAGFVCLSSSWKIKWPIILSLVGTVGVVGLELVSIGTSFHLLHRAEAMANEELVHPWYWVECQLLKSCHLAMLEYIHWNVVPQIILTAISILLQLAGLTFLTKLFKTIRDHRKMVSEYGVWYQENQKLAAAAKKPKKGSSKKNKSESNKKRSESVTSEGQISLHDLDKKETEEGGGRTPSATKATPLKKFLYGIMPTPKKNKGMTPKSILHTPKRTGPEATYHTPKSIAQGADNYHTPSSILKTDHGYVHASGSSLDPDHYSKGDVAGPSTACTTPANTSEKLAQPQSISFNTHVQVHCYEK